jgi:hypothetical protein
MLFGVNGAFQLPAGYPELLQDLKSRIRDAQVRVSFVVSREVVVLYWSIGREILKRQRVAGWGPRLLIGCLTTCRYSFPGLRGIVRGTSSTRGRWQRSGPTPKKCHSLWHFCHEATSEFFSISSKSLLSGNGISERWSNTVGAAMYWFSRSRAVFTRGKVRP